MENRITIEEIVRNIEREKQFEATPLEGGFLIKISKYVPFCCTAVHDGSQLRKELKSKIALDDYERWYEEDPSTADFIASMPVTIVGLDSRYEYDLNRSPDACIYKEAWGKTVWNKKLSNQDIATSKRKHNNYYKVLEALLCKIEELYGGCVLYDIHSYNYLRYDRELPLFNIGTSTIDKSKFGDFVTHWIKELQAMHLPDIENVTTENDIFQGKGYNAEFIAKSFSNTLVLSTDIKKVYCNELNGDLYPKVVRRLQQKLKVAILHNAHFFSNRLENWSHPSPRKLLDKNIPENLQKIDDAIYSLLWNFELLAAINPSNTNSERRKFFKHRFSEPPVFKYYPVKINPYSLKQDLLSIPIQRIHDVSIRHMYESVVNAYTDKIDMLGTLNTQKFHYNSLRYFGRPSRKDLTNASYILHLPDIPGEAKKEPIYSAEEAMDIFRDALVDYKIDAKVELSNKVVSEMLVINSRKCILFQPEAKFKRRELQALVEHEIGVHMVTTMNSSQMDLKVFNIGLPVNTLTQEGLAVLSEYLSGNITLRRLRSIALRVVLVDMLCNGASFIDCFQFLVNEHDIEEEDAFLRVTRIFRGGGFTKDYLYLSGFVKIYKLWLDQYDLTPLLVGKTSLPAFGTIEEMIDREMIAPPHYKTKSLMNPKAENNNPIYEYLFSGLKH